MTVRRRPGRRPPSDRDVLLEFINVGRLVKVCAIDPRTGTEVVVVGPANAAQADLTRAAVRKLQYVLRKKRRQAEGGGDPKGGFKV